MTTRIAASLLLTIVLAVILSTVALLPVDASVSPPPNGPHYAYVQMQMIEISKIDGVEQAFHADFYMLTTWAAPLTGTPFNGTESLSKADLDLWFWTPSLEFVNERDAVTRLADEPYAFASELDWNVSVVTPGYSLPPGWIWITEDQRFICDFTTDLGMQDFPFDSQYMQFLIESFSWTYDDVRVRWAIPEALDELVPHKLNIVGWTFIFSEQEETPAPGVYYSYNKKYYPRLTVRAQLDRQPNYYLSKIVAGVIMLVYMAIWIFSLAVDEADRQMGTLQIFAGLVTFLFVASGDTPKVPYQTRLDVFMLWSFFNVTFMLFIHGSLYYWRECDVEDLLEERERAGIEQEEKENALIHANEKLNSSPLHSPTTKDHHTTAVSIDPSHIELERISSPSVAYDTGRLASGSTTRRRTSTVHQKGPIAHIPIPQVHTTTWRLREDAWSQWTLRKWFLGLHATRKWDATIIPFLFLMYSLGVAIIFGRPVSGPRTI